MQSSASMIVQAWLHVTSHSGSIILTTESLTRCSIAPAYMNIHKPYLIPSISMDPGAWCRCLACKHNRYHLVWGTDGPYTVVWETEHTNPNRLDCVSVVLVRSPMLNECRKDNNLVYTHRSTSATMYMTDHAPIEFWRCSCAGLVNIHEVTSVVIVTLLHIWLNLMA